MIRLPLIIFLAAYNLPFSESYSFDSIEQKSIPNYIDGNHFKSRLTILDILNQFRFLSSIPVKSKNEGKTTEWARQLVQRFQDYGLESEVDEASLHQVVSWTERTNRKPLKKGINNVVALLEGTRNGENHTGNEIFILVSHYKAWDESPGREARMSGMVALLETARMVSVNATLFPQKSILFVALDWQEKPEIAAAYFVDNYVYQMSKKEAKFSGVLVFGSVLLYNGSVKAQIIPKDYKQIFPEEMKRITKGKYKGDWLAAIQFGATSVGDVFQSYWKKTKDKEFKSIPLVWDIEPNPESPITKTPIIPFYVGQGTSSLFLTDTYFSRDPLRACFTRESFCKSMKLLSLENLKFLKKIIHVAALTSLDISEADAIDIAKVLLEGKNKTKEKEISEDTNSEDTEPVRADGFRIQGPAPKATFYWLKEQYRFLLNLDKNQSENAWYKGLMTHFRQHGFSVHLENGQENEVESWALENDYHVVKNPIQNVIARLKGSHHNITGVQTKVFIVCSHYRESDEKLEKQVRLSGTVALMEVSRLIAFSKFKPKYDILFVVLDRKHDAIYAGNYLMDKYFNRLRNDLNAVFGGAIILSTIYNYNLDSKSQSLPQGFSEVFPESDKDIKDDGSKGNFLATFQFGQEPLMVNYLWEKLDFDNIDLLSLRIPKDKSVEVKHLFQSSAIMPFYQFSKYDGARQNILMLSDTGEYRKPGNYCDKPKSCTNIDGIKMSQKGLLLLHKATSLAILACLDRSEAQYINKPSNMWEQMYDWISNSLKFTSL